MGETRRSAAPYDDGYLPVYLWPPGSGARTRLDRPLSHQAMWLSPVHGKTGRPLATLRPGLATRAARFCLLLSNNACSEEEGGGALPALLI